MGWNGSERQSENQNRNAQSGKSGKHAPRPLWLRGLAAGIIVAAIGAAVLWTLRPERHSEPAPLSPEPSPAIAEVQPAAAASASAADTAKSAPIDPKARPTKVGEVVNGYVMLPSGRIHKPTGAVTNRVADYAKSPYSIFDHRTDNEIARMIMMEPGATLVGTIHYRDRFAKQFLESLKTPIIVSADDEPWKADLKRAVIQARMELKDAYDRGEDIEELMSETRQQLQDLSRYKQSLRQIYAQSLKECATAEDVETLQQSVNKLLEDRGCAPMNFTPLTRRNLMKDKSHE